MRSDIGIQRCCAWMNRVNCGVFQRNRFRTCSCRTGSDRRAVLGSFRSFTMTTEAKEVEKPPGVYADERIAFPVQVETAPKDLLSYGPRGVYTTARTIRHDQLFQFDKQVDRLVESATLMILEDCLRNGYITQEEETAPLEEKIGLVTKHFPEYASLLDTKQVSKKIHEVCRRGIDELDRTREDWAKSDLRITLLYSWQPQLKAVPQENLNKLPVPRESSLQHWRKDYYGDLFQNSHSILSGYFTKLPSRPEGPVKTVVRGSPRLNAAAKDSAWVKTRKSLEEKMENDMEETILIDKEEKTLVEGLQTNFMIIHDGVLYTAGQHVLNGTVRQLVLEVCEANDIPYKLEAPPLAKLSSLEAAFITSTSRLILPIDEIKIPADIIADVRAVLPSNSDQMENEDMVIRLRSKESPVLQRLRLLLDQALESHSKKV